MSAVDQKAGSPVLPQADTFDAKLTGQDPQRVGCGERPKATLTGTTHFICLRKRERGEQTP